MTSDCTVEGFPHARGVRKDHARPSELSQYGTRVLKWHTVPYLESYQAFTRFVCPNSAHDRYAWESRIVGLLQDSHMAVGLLPGTSGFLAFGNSVFRRFA